MNSNLNKQLYSLLNNTRLMAQKANLVSGFTNGREESTKGMTDAEAMAMIRYLRTQNNKKDEAANRMRKRIISMAHEMGWHNLVDGRWVADMRAIDTWCVLRSYLKKELNKYTADELPKLVSQFERVYKSFLKKF
jgi:hypothetical protein